MTMGIEDESEELGVATALERTRALEGLLRRAIYDTHAVGSGSGLAADSAELERKSLLAVNEQLGLLGLKLRQYSQLGPREYSKKTLVLSELDELRRDLITVSYTNEHAVVVAKGTLRDVRKFAEMRTEDDGLSDEDSEAYLSDENANIDADSKQDCGALTDMGTEEDDVRSGTAAAVRQSLKSGGSSASEQHRELEQALSRVEASLAQTKTRKGDQQPSANITKQCSANTTVQDAVVEVGATAHRPPTTFNKNGALPQNMLSLQLPTRAESKESCTRQQSDSLEGNEERQSALQQSIKREEGMSRELHRVSSLDAMSDSATTSTATSADSPAPLPTNPNQSKEKGSEDITSALNGLSDKLQSNAADTILSGSTSAASQRLAAWRPQSIPVPPTDRAAGSIADSSSSSSSSVSHEGDSASSVTSSDHLRVSRLKSHTSTGLAVQPTTSGLHKSDKKETLAVSAAAGASESLRGRYGQAGEAANDDSRQDYSPELTQSVISKHLATQRGRFKPQTLPGSCAGQDMQYGGTVNTNSFSGDKGASASITAPEPKQCSKNDSANLRDMPKAEPRARRYEPRRNTKPVARGREAQENRSGEKPRAIQRRKRPLIVVLATAVVAGAAALLSPAFSSPARDEWKREMCSRLGRMRTPKQLASRMRVRSRGRAAVPAVAPAAVSTYARSPLLELYPDGDLGRG